LEEAMKKTCILLATAAAFAIAAPAVSMAQGISVDTPVGGVRIGEPHPYHGHYGYTGRYSDGPVVERRVYRERSVGMNCRTVTIERDDGSMKRIRRCD
jgi:hypothetical protein